MVHDVARFGRLLTFGLAALVLLSLTACGGPPKWVTKGSGVMNENDKKAFYGVGMIDRVTSEPMALEAAEGRARAEIARNFQTYTAYLMRDYAASTAAGVKTTPTEEQNIERAVKTFAAVTLSGVRKIDQYHDEKKNMYYVLAKLEFDDAMKQALEQSKELNNEVRDYVKKNAERLFDKLEKEETKQAATK